MDSGSRHRRKGLKRCCDNLPDVRTFPLLCAEHIVLGIGLAFAIRMATTIARAETLHELLIDEINHRVKNTLATVQSLASQTFRSGTDAASRNKFDARLASLGRAHDVLSAKKWEGADIGEVVAATLEPFASASPHRIAFDGLLSLVLHELATNAAKYGALSGPVGRVTVSWTLEPHDTVKLNWRESGGPPVGKPDRVGFGSTLIEKGFTVQMGGSATLRYERDGLTCALEFPPH